MSVQVRRRRESAAFLASFVGAQGELLVETTNNRVQVHDGTTPGGYAAAAIRDLPGHNAGINTNFGINQRSYASGTSLAAGAYGHDRHKAGANGCTYTFVQGMPDTSITITAGTLIQPIDVGNVTATSFWLTWTGTATARVWQGVAGGTLSAGTALTIDGVPVNALLVIGLTIGTITNIEFATGSLGTTRPWQFEAALPNAGPTRLDRRHGELALCQRYYQICYFTFRFPATAAGQNIETYGLFNATMRAAPTAVNVNSVVGQSGNRGNVSSVNVYTFAGNIGPASSCRFNLLSSAAGDTYALLDAWSFSAEI